jgi:8-oxo-dGTP pyrophosphatase MutT (NUDIX family)
VFIERKKLAMPISSHLKQLRSKVGNALIQIPGVAAVVRDESGRVLLQRRTDNNQWSLPAGAIDLGETPARAVVREVWEETSLKVRPSQLLGVFSGHDFRYIYPNGDRVEGMIALFECVVVEGKVLAGRDGETADLQYFYPKDMPQLALAYPHQLFALNNSSKTYFEWKEEWLKELS